MLQNERHQRIIEAVRRDGYAEVSNLAEILGASGATIRRDLAYLEDQHLLMRTHGGAVLASGSTSQEPPLRVKRSRMVEAKRLIGRAAAELVSPGQTILLDAGSTTWQVAHHLLDHQHLVIVSNDLQILHHLADIPTFTVVDTGGVIRKSVYTLMGHRAESFIRTIHANWTFLGADAVHTEHGITNVNLEEAPIKQAMIRAGMKVVVVADHTKIDKVVFAKVCDLNEVHILITDSGIEEGLAAAIRETGVELQIVSLTPPQEARDPDATED